MPSLGEEPAQNLLTLFASTAWAQTRQSATTDPKPIYSQVPFDLGAAQLRPHFAGNDIVALYDALNRLHTVQKDEFETTDQFNNRVAALKRSPVVGSIATRAVLAFLIPPFSYQTGRQPISNTPKDSLSSWSGHKRVSTVRTSACTDTR
jgi:hypothetical protein